MSADNPTVRLVRGTHEPVDIQPSQVTPLALARIFSVSYFLFSYPAFEVLRVRRTPCSGYFLALHSKPLFLQTVALK